MILALFATLIQSKTKICICNGECSILCPSNTYSVTSDYNFYTYIISYHKNEKEFEFDLYSFTDGFLFDIDLSYFNDAKINLKTLIDSKPVKIAFKHGESHFDQIKIDPNHQIMLPQLDSAKNANTLNQQLIKNSNQAYLNPKDSTPDQTITTNPDGLINITCDRLSYSDNWKDTGKCYSKNNADSGSYSYVPNSKAFLRFNGTKVHLLFNRHSKSGLAKVYIDSVKVADLSLYSATKFYQVVFTSDELPFGEHLIEIEHVGSTSQSICITSISYDPLPKQGGKLGFEQMEKTVGQWEIDSNNPLVFSSNSDGATGTFKFYGTRFWITGVRDGTHGKFTVIIDDKITEKVDLLVSGGDLPTFLKNSFPALLYQSNVLPFGEHTVKIVRDQNEVSLVNFLYANQPYNGVYLPYNELTKKGTWREQEGGYLSRQTSTSLSTFRFLDHLWIVGNSKYDEAIMNIYYNYKKEANIDTSSIRTELSNEVVLYEKVSDTDSYELKIENAGDGQSTSSQKYLHISYCYYVNEKTIVIDDEYENIEINEMQQDGSWTTESQTLYTEKKGSKLTATYSGDKFWISGNVGPKYGHIDITLDGQILSTVSLYREKYESNIVYYESPNNINFGFHTIQLSNPSDKAVNVYRIHYNPIPDDQGTMDNLDGLINITCDQFSYSGSWIRCVDNVNANFGSYTFNNGDSASFIFNGTRAYVYAYREKKSSDIQIKVDDQLIGKLNIASDSNRGEVIYSTNELPFGEHKIEVIHDGANQKSLVLASFFINPLPKRGGFKLGFKDRDAETGIWEESTEGTPTFSSTSPDASITFKFHGTRFWLTGERSSTKGKVRITIDDETIDIDRSSSSGFANGNKAILLYQSKILELNDHTVTISRLDQDISLANFLYSNQPHNSIFVDSKEFSQIGEWEEFNGGHSSNTKGSALNIEEFMNHVWIIGNKEISKSIMNVYYNVELDKSIDTNLSTTATKSTEILLYERQSFSIDTYDLKIENNADQLPLHISYLYYRNDRPSSITQEHRTIGINDLTHDGSWTTQSQDDNINNLYTDQKDATVTFQITCTKFWISGSMDPNYGEVDIILNGKRLSTVSLYQEKHENNVVYYESPNITFAHHTIKLTNPTNKGINVYQIHYYQSPDDQSIIDNLDGLINITCDKFQYNENKNWYKCTDHEWANVGSYTFMKGGKTWYTFNGSKVYVYANRESNACNAIIRIDNKVAAYVNLQSPTDKKDVEIVFSSNDLPFGEHTIEIENDGPTNDHNCLVIASLFINPLPKIGGYKLGLHDSYSKTGLWTENKTGTPVFSSTSVDASITFKFHGTRFWITGVRSSTLNSNSIVGQFDIKIDEKDPFTINEIVSNGNYIQFADRNKAVLLYQSDVFELQDHTVVISRNGYDIELVNFFYNNQPYNGVCVPYNEMNKEGSWTIEQNGYLSNNQGSSLSVVEYFTHFWILGNREHKGASMNVYYNDNKDESIDTGLVSTETSSRELLLHEHKKIPIDLYTLKIEHNDSTQKSLHISYLYYLNEATFSIEGEHETVNIDDMQYDDTWTLETSNSNINSNSEGTTIITQYSGRRFWISGSLGPNYGNVDIIFDDEKIATVSLYHEKQQNNVIYYQSAEDIKYGYHTIILSNPSNKGINVYQIHYDAIPENQEVMDNLDGLINITCDKINYDTNWEGECIKNSPADQGSYTKIPGASASFTFNGTHVYIYAYRKTNSPRIKVFIDDKLVAVPTLSVSENRAEIVYSSDELPFGEHTIKAVHDGTSDQEFVLRSFIVDPLPKRGGFKLGFKDRDAETGIWEESTEGTPTFSSTSPDASITFKFHGTRFWLTGERSSTKGKVRITIDDETIDIDRSSSSGFANGNKAILLYQSNALEVKDYTVKISGIDQNITLVNFLYSNQPYNGICVDSKDFTKTGNWIEENGGYSSQMVGSTLTIEEYLNRVWIFGNNELSKSYMNVYYNNQLDNTIDTSQITTSTKTTEILLYNKEDLSINTYNLKIENKGNNQDTNEQPKLHISYLYYLNDGLIEIDPKSERIDSNEINNRTGNWIEDSLAGDTKNIYTDVEGASVTVEFTGGKFWLVGSVGPNYGVVEILIDDKVVGHVSLYREKNENNVIYYESENVVFEDHRLTLLNTKNKRISVCQIYYDPVTPTFEFTPSKTFTQSDAFTESSPFTQSSVFTKSSPFTQSSVFTKSAAFSPSEVPIDPLEKEPSCSVDGSNHYLINGKRCDYQSSDDSSSSVISIVRSNFTDIEYNSDGGAITIKNAGFACNNVEFINCSSTNGGGGGIYIKNDYSLDYNLTFENLYFERCHAIYGGAIFIHYDSEINSISILACTFVSNYAATSNPDETQKNLFGGGSIFLTSEKAVISKCKFRKSGKGGSIKLLPTSGKEKILLNSENVKIILLSECSFEIEDESESSIRIEASVMKNRINVIGCKFKGKLAKGSHYIEGKLPPNEAEKIFIQSCIFEDKRSQPVSFEAIDELALMKVNSKKKAIILCVTVLMATVIFTVLKLAKSHNGFSDIVIN